MKKFFALLAGVALLGTMAAGCASTSGSSSGTTSKVSGSITASGSSALYPLVNDAKKKFQKLNPDVSITLNAGGSGAGLKAVSDGSVDIGNSDVEAGTKLDATAAGALVDHKIAVIGIAAIVNSDVGAKVTNLTSQQLTDIFTGTVTNWKDVGGPDEAITLVTRPDTSGTKALFEKIVMNGKSGASNKSLETDDSGTLLQNVQTKKGSIGYVALSYLTTNTSVNTVKIDGVDPTIDNIYNGTYKVAGYEHMYTKGEPKGAVKAFLDYMQSEQYADSVETLGYCVTTKMKNKLS